MYVCDFCGQAFDDPVEIKDEREHFGHLCHETFYVSPCCGEGFESAYDCKVCGAVVQVIEVDNGLCERCQTATEKKLKAFCDTLTQPEKSYLNMLMVGVDDVF